VDHSGIHRGDTGIRSTGAQAVVYADIPRACVPKQVGGQPHPTSELTRIQRNDL
jgi:hypothetical protein